MKRDFDVVVQQGHVARKKGATGTAGHRGTEQEFVKILGPMIVDRLVVADLTVALIGADDDRPTAEVFLALHQDGSKSKNARGASVGFPVHGDGETLTTIWKSLYHLAGWPGGFRRANYTIGLRWYFAFGGLRRAWWRKAKYDAAFLIEHGFATTISEENWMWDNFDKIADADANTIIRYLKGTTTGDIMATLQRGSSGPWVKVLQTILNEANNAGLVIDGGYGKNTEAAVRAYEMILGTPTDGVWGPPDQKAHAARTTQPPPPPAPTPEPSAVTGVTIEALTPLIAQLDKITSELKTLIDG